MSEKSTIGKYDSDTTGYLFSGVKNIVPAENGEILADNSGSSTIRVFNKEGIFLREFGGRGKGPGEFQEVSHIHVYRDTVIITDRMMDRVSFFSLNGTFLYSKQIADKALGTFQFAYYNDTNQSYYLGYRDYINARENGNLIHIYDSEKFDKVRETADIFGHIFDAENAFEQRFSIAPRYLSTMFGVDFIAFVNFIYEGTVTVLKNDTVESYGSKTDDTYEILDWSISEFEKRVANKETGIGAVSGQDGLYIYRLKGANFGLIGNSKFLLRFYMIFKGKKMVPYLDIYNHEGDLLKKIELNDTGITFDRENQMSVKPLYLDENNTIYVSDHYYNGEYPAIRVFETNLADLLLE